MPLDIPPVSGFAGSTNGWGALVTPAASGDELPAALLHVHAMAQAHHWPGGEHVLPALLVFALEGAYEQPGTESAWHR